MTKCFDVEFPEDRLVKFDGNVIADGMPPPVVTAKSEVQKGNCAGFNGYRRSNISINGELTCCDVDEKIAAREALLSTFSSDCGDLSVCGETWEDCRVQSVDISTSHYRDNVPYTITLIWTDPDFPDKDSAKITDASDVVEASEDDTMVTVIHRVSAKTAETEGCDGGCDCDVSSAKDWATGRISSSAPTPAAIDIPQNQGGDTLSCPDIQESIDLVQCTYEISKTWQIAKNPVVVDDEDGNRNITSTKCVTTSEDRNQLVTISVSGTITYVGGVVSCDDPNDPKFMSEVEGVFASTKEKIISEYSGKHGSPDSTSINKSENPATISYTIEFRAEPLGDTRGDTIDEYCVAGSISGDGIISVTVSGTMRANDAKLKSQSKQCRCEIVQAEFDSAKYKGIGLEFYDRFKSLIDEEALKNLVGPCHEDNSLNPTPRRESEKEGKDDCAMSYSYTWDDMKEKEEQWNYSVNITHEQQQVKIQPLLGGKFCVIKGDEDPGTVNVSGQRSQECLDDPEWDKEGIAKGFIKEVLPGETMKTSGKNKDCIETKTYAAGAADSAFNYSYEYGGNV
jgi:hypothetical protein